ncbi:CsbD family protein [Streptomyces pacificus]|uniref:CsbD family protein n=1 Tax=Streptomyces pacificus TaxID=2705029 RepID=A0A6A0APK9_9ACTN|nr:CsbD family protein [Streptomyces pacificus]GFH34223.1 CsbD family protein [Streptomyces pacificus]
MSKHNAKARQIKGKLKETLGKTMGDKSMRRSGRNDMLRGKAQEMAEKAAGQVRKHTRHH